MVGFDYKQAMTSNQAYSPPSNNQGSPGGPGGYNPSLNPPEVTYTSPPQNNNQDDNNQEITPEIVPNVSTGMGLEDLKVQAQQKRAAEQKQKYIDKLKGFAASMSSSPGLYGSIYGPEAEEMFNPYNDPTLDDDPDTPGVQSNLYNLEEGAGFSGNIPITDYQKLKFLSDYGLGSGLGSFMATDSSGNAILDSSGNIIMTGLGNNLSDTWAETFDPGGINPKDDEGNFIDYSGLGIREYLEGMSKNYFDKDFYGSDYWDDYLGEYYGPTERSSYEKNKRWQQKSLGEILQEGPAGFGDLQRIYGEELSETSGNPFAAVAQYNKQGAFSPSFGESIITEYS